MGVKHLQTYNLNKYFLILDERQHYNIFRIYAYIFWKMFLNLFSGPRVLDPEYSTVP